MQHAWGRVLVRTARRSSRSTLATARVACQLRSAAPAHAVARCTGSVRFESTESTPSRFLDLADGDKADKDEDAAEGDDADGDKEDGEGKDGDIEVDAIADVNKGGVEENEELDELVMELFMENPLKWTPTVLARKFHLAKPRVEAIIWMKRMEAELTPEEFRAKVQEAKDKTLKEQKEQAKKLADAEAAGNDKEVARLKKRARQEEEATQPDEALSASEEAVLMGIDDEAFRNPDFFFLSDEFEGYPPLVRRMGKHGHTDQLYPEEALELQRLAGNNKITLQKSFANPKNSESKAKFRLAVKDITTKKKHLLLRDESRTLRLATNEEVLPRTWVRRPAYFRGLDKELA
ncbi:hypothetical protein PHYSODRAFT_553371 [Phytophthora sojae]|uniref:Uncharacterized protein n=1 Tax=Phytophthora sojae (strain P6497) TaxID=1094619 RepID=G4YLF2_PHYSP|nr:hypothetical protein PHYSODRAFT_553371 [Phytophthora sojae]EGZ30326.1 hypothetical protein PHYSODRAFT_553371 [Phytophthora sojae]|eukprot:XP_009517601.1 hypothetical protein PHYSODRAFT_553371 [Phytophthora sojae]